MAEEDKISKVDIALGKYYESQGASYDNIFKNYCDDGGMDEEGLAEDMAGGYEESVFPDALDEDNKFPGAPSGKDKEDERKKFIFDIILKCWKNPDIVFEAKKVEDKKKEIKPQKDDDEKKEGEDKREVKNGLVLMIGISEYDKRVRQLPGVCDDTVNYRNLWEKEYNYKVWPSESDKSKWYNKKNWTNKEIREYIEEGRELLFEKRDQVHDGLIVIICCHGGKGVIYPSDCVISSKMVKVKDDKGEEKDQEILNVKGIDIIDLHAKVNAQWNHKAAKIPRLFILDCCRGEKEDGVVFVDDQDIKRGKDSVHQDDLLGTLYGNSPGIMVSEIKGEGGYFSVCLIDELKKKNGKNLSEISRAASKALKKKSGDAQRLDKTGDPEMDVVIFVPK